jgi:hypothetical protein
MRMILPKRVKVHVGKRLEFVYKTVTILQKFHSRENSHLRELYTDAPRTCGKTHEKIITIKNNDPSKKDVMKISPATVLSLNCSPG